MTTGADLVTRVLNQIRTSQRVQINKLAAAIDAVTNPVEVQFAYSLNGIQEGSYVDVDLERMFVWQVTDPTDNKVLVERAQGGTTIAAHLINTVAEVNVEFGKWAAFQAINDTLNSMSADGIYAMRSVEITYSGGVFAYVLTSTLNPEQIYQVSAKMPGTTKENPIIEGWELRQLQNTTDFPSGEAIFLYESGFVGQPIRVLFKAALAPLASLASDVLSVSGLHTEAHDIPALGAVMSLVPHTEIKRNTTVSQGDTRRAQEVPPSARMRSAAGAVTLYDKRVKEEKRRLARLYPYRTRTHVLPRTSARRGR